jgi:Tol biopolymer transport system component
MSCRSSSPIIVLNSLLIVILFAGCQPTVSAGSSPSIQPTPRISPIPIVQEPLQFSIIIGNTIYLLNSNGSGLTTLNDEVAGNGNPTWTLDGKWIIFCGQQGDTPGIFMINPNGTDLHQIPLPVPACNHQWARNIMLSPDGNWIAFLSFKGDLFDLYIARLDGSNLSRMNDTSFPRGGGIWSPDSQSMLVNYNRDGQENINKIDIHGTFLARLTNEAATDVPCAYSPDGKQILFYSKRSGSWQIFTMKADGSNQTQLTHTSADEMSPVWSPEGIQIYFTSKRDGNRDIYVMNADGSGQTNLTKSPEDENYFWLSPDGRMMIVMGTLNNVFDLWVMNVDGTGKTDLTKTLGGVGYAAWKP